MGASATHVPRVSAQSVLCTSVPVSPTGLPFGAVGLNGYNRWGEFQHYEHGVHGYGEVVLLCNSPS